MVHACITVIRQEHRALSAMLRAIKLLLAEHRRRATAPDFGALRAMLFYVDEFPEQLHHPKESRLLFPKLRGRSVHADAVLDRLDRDHAHGARAIRDLEHALLAYEMTGPSPQRDARRDAFEAEMVRYIDFYLEHMRIEEAEVLPLAEALLGPDDWAELDAAFLANRDPLTGHPASDAYQPLFARIVATLPGKSGVGSALEALARAGPPAPDTPGRDTP